MNPNQLASVKPADHDLHLISKQDTSRLSMMRVYKAFAISAKHFEFTVTSGVQWLRW